MTLKKSYEQQLKEYEFKYSYWQEIHIHYTEPSRWYHNLSHLENIYANLLPVRKVINDWTSLIFAVAYHDVIYDPTAKDNEEKSADFAVEQLNRAQVPFQIIEHTRDMIIATKMHDLSEDYDTNYFTDSDLSTLGFDSASYREYSKNVRREYSVYPDNIYWPGRKKELEKLLKMPSIYKTEYFRSKYELQARINIEEEIEMANEVREG
jgi:predicted metal-dependent HD superfamily phosphohydrolase